MLVDERLVDAGDWTGPGGAAMVLARSDVQVGVLETARGGIVLRGVGYESNDASVLTNVSSDHLDLQGIHTLPELAEVKSVIARITKPDGWVVLNGDDPLVAAVRRRVRGQVALFSTVPDGTALVRRHVAGGGRGYVLRDGLDLYELEGRTERKIVDVARVPITIGGIARHNVANVMAAAGAARGLGATIEQVRRGLVDFRPSSELSPGRLNLFRLGQRVVIVDFAHNEAGVAAVLDVAEGIAGGAAGRTAPITAIVGTAGDRPDDTLRGIGLIAAKRAQRVAIKETLKYLRGRTRASVVGEILAGMSAGGVKREAVPVYESETAALRAELNGTGPAPAADGARPDSPRVIVLMCHEDREGVFELLSSMGARPVDVASELTELVPRLQQRRRAELSVTLGWVCEEDPVVDGPRDAHRVTARPDPLGCRRAARARSRAARPPGAARTSGPRPGRAPRRRSRPRRLHSAAPSSVWREDPHPLRSNDQPDGRATRPGTPAPPSPARPDSAMAPGHDASPPRRPSRS